MWLSQRPKHRAIWEEGAIIIWLRGVNEMTHKVLSAAVPWPGHDRDSRKRLLDALVSLSHGAREEIEPRKGKEAA